MPHHWVSIPINLICVVSILGNSIILFLICTDPALHEPMYIFLSMLAASDLGLWASIFPTMVQLFWLGVGELPFNLCAAQMFFIHMFTYVEFGVLLAMAFDHFVAIRDPLHCASVLTHSAMAKVGPAILVRAILLNLPGPSLLQCLLFPQISVPSHCYCLHVTLWVWPAQKLRSTAWLAWSPSSSLWALTLPSSYSPMPCSYGLC